MNFKDFLYLIVIGFVRTVKWVELQFLKLFSTWLIAKAVKTGRERMGIIFHLSEESHKNWGPAEEEAALEDCKDHYDSLVHIKVKDPLCIVYAANRGNWGVGEGYVDGKWDFCKDEGDLSEFSCRFNEENMKDLYFNWWNKLLQYLEFELFNLQTRARSWEVAKKHYDLGNDLYEAMLDPWLQYSCGYWANADNLNDAQQAKMELIAQKLKLKPGMRVLDIGCGWGMLCKYLAEKHGVECVGVTLSKEGMDYGRKVCQGLPVEIRLQDYRDLDEKFDRIVSVGMFEHVGKQNYETYFEVASNILKPEGIFLFHSIAENDPTPLRCESWVATRIFPGGRLPSARDIIKATEGLFVIEDWHNFGFYYSRTLKAWRDNFIKAWPSLKNNYDDKFYRMWIYYLSLSEGGFKSRKFQLYQIVLTKHGMKEGYRSVR